MSVGGRVGRHRGACSVWYRIDAEVERIDVRGPLVSRERNVQLHHDLIDEFAGEYLRVCLLENRAGRAAFPCTSFTRRGTIRRMVDNGCVICDPVYRFWRLSRS